MSEIAAENKNSLCLSCGFCCDGTLFGRVPLRKDDPRVPLRAVGIHIETKEGKSSFGQPCSAFRSDSCHVYADRPASCRSFRCDLLKEFESGGVSREDALSRIAKAKSLKAQLRSELESVSSDLAGISIPDIMNRVPLNEELARDPALLKKWGSALLLLSALMERIRSDFCKKRWPEDKAG